VILPPLVFPVCNQSRFSSAAEGVEARTVPCVLDVANVADNARVNEPLEKNRMKRGETVGVNIENKI
jgi:hypothetical protein